ncbi:hypothetical protein CYMTET_51877, partial [Cymbomonas tetramitiformis]
ITLVRKANVDVAEEEEARLSGFFGQFLQDFKSMCYIFAKDQKSDPLASEPIIEQTEEGMIRRRASNFSKTLPTNAMSAADRFGTRPSTLPVGAPRRWTFHVFRKRNTFSEQPQPDMMDRQEMQELFTQ